MIHVKTLVKSKVAHWNPSIAALVCCNQNARPLLRILRLNTPRETAQWLVVAQRSVLVTQDVDTVERCRHKKQHNWRCVFKISQGQMFRHVLYLYITVSIVCQQIVARMVFLLLKSRQRRSFLDLDASIPFNFVVASHLVLNVYVDICWLLLWDTAPRWDYPIGGGGASLNLLRPALYGGVRGPGHSRVAASSSSPLSSCALCSCGLTSSSSKDWHWLKYIKVCVEEKDVIGLQARHGGVTWRHLASYWVIGCTCSFHCWGLQWWKFLRSWRRAA